MPKIGFPKTKMSEERRIALLPEDINDHIKNPRLLYFERGYGRDFGIKDRDYRLTGAHIVDRKTAYSLEVLCQPKFCENDLSYLGMQVRTVFGWLHLDKDLDKNILEVMEKSKITAIAWEFMERDKRKVFEKNSMLTGEIGILHAMNYFRRSSENCSVAVIGRKTVAQAAINQLKTLGFNRITVYHTQNSTKLKDDLETYDVLVDCACSSTEILDSNHLKKMKPGALLIDMGRSCMWGGYKPQSIYSPIVYINEGRNPVYCIKNIPTLVYQIATRFISRDVAPYIELLTSGKIDDTLRDATVVQEGIPIIHRL